MVMFHFYEYYSNFYLPYRVQVRFMHAESVPRTLSPAIRSEEMRIQNSGFSTLFQQKADIFIDFRFRFND